MAVISENLLEESAKLLKEAVVGIDLGTSFSVAAVMDGDQPKVISNDEGEALVPSVVSFTEDDEIIVGREARARSLADPEHTVYSVKRLIGKSQDELKQVLGMLPYQVEDAERKLVRIKIREKQLTPQEISSMILKEVKSRAEKVLSKKVTRAVITVPAYFDDAQRQATRDAGRIAGLDVLRIINEPTAASLAYGLDQKKKGIVAIFDLGGGTFDISILRIADGIFQVLNTLGDTFLGGDDFDRQLIDLAAEDIKEQNGFDPRQNPLLLQALRDVAESTKIALTDQDSAVLSLKLDDPAIDYQRTVTRSEFESMIGELVQKTLDYCKTAVSEASLKFDRIEDVVMVGGSTRVPLVRRKVEELFGRKPHTDLNPDEVVALGAAIQAKILSGGFKEMMVLDVTPLSLGIETFGGSMSKLIMRNSSIPCRESEQFSTFADSQTSVDIHILQGEREMAEDCRSLGKWKLTGIPPMSAGVPKIVVTFTLDANGVLKVNAKEERSGQELDLYVTPSTGLTEQAVERMVLESVEHAKEDVLERQLIEARNEAESIRIHTLKAFEQADSECSPEMKEKIETALKEMLETVQDASDVHQAMDAIDQFNEISEPLAQVIMDGVVQSELGGKKMSEL